MAGNIETDPEFMGPDAYEAWKKEQKRKTRAQDELDAREKRLAESADFCEWLADRLAEWGLFDSASTSPHRETAVALFRKWKTNPRVWGRLSEQCMKTNRKQGSR